MTDTTVNPQELKKFSPLGARWWDTQGPMAPLHVIQPHRLDYIKEQASIHFQKHPDQVLHGLDVVDVGCGGGLVCEPLARMGASVTGIDPEEHNIEAASAHASQQGLDVHYHAQTVQAFWQDTHATFDIVLSLEVVEHVDNIDTYIQECARLVKPGGMMILSTLNRTMKSFATAVVGAEYILRWLPAGTHDWRKFVTPQELKEYVSRTGLEPVDTCGLRYNPVHRQWSLDRKDCAVNYFLTAVRPT